MATPGRQGFEEEECADATPQKHGHKTPGCYDNPEIQTTAQAIIKKQQQKPQLICKNFNAMD